MSHNVTSIGTLLVLLCAYYSVAFNDVRDFCVNKCVQHPDITSRWDCLRTCEAELRDIVRDDVIARHAESSSRKRRSIDEEFVPEWVGGEPVGVSGDNQARTFGVNGKDGGALSRTPQGTLLRVMNIGNLPPNSYESFENSHMASGNKRNNRGKNVPSFARIGKSFWRVPENEKRSPRSFVRVGKAIPLDEQEDTFIFDPVIGEGSIDYVMADKRTGLGSYVRIGRSNPLAGGNDADPSYYDESEFTEKRNRKEGKSFMRVGRDAEVPAPKYTDARGRSLGSRSFVRIGKKYEENEEKLGGVGVVEDKQPVSVVRLEKRDTLSAVAKETKA